MSETKYPVYRRYRICGKEIGGIYGKLNSDGSSVVLKFAIMNPKNFTILHFVEPDYFKPFMGPDFLDITRDEFEKAYGQAQYQLTKANVEQ